jgi:peptidoglycan/xylan/chitin deacetylase (PgdA/CDA1 family)
MDEFVDNLKKEKNEFMLTITFDDGYKDNLLYALPILEKFEVPALIYITTNFLKQNVDLWWYELMETIQNRSAINFNYEKQNFDFILKNQKQKFSAYNNLRKTFLKLRIDKQIELLKIITGTKKRKNYSKICLNQKEVKALDDHTLITIGSHSHNHLNFKILSNNEIQYEVNKSLEILEDLLNHKIKHFCYPYGGKKQVSVREYNIIEKLNLSSAVTGRAYPIKRYNLFSLPRIYVGKNICNKALINHLSGFYNLANKFL